MEQYVKQPNIPQESCKQIFVGRLGEDAKHLLNHYNISIIDVAPNQDLPENISTHADLNLLYLGNGKIIKAENGQLGLSYPDDAKFNVAIVGKYCFCNTKTVQADLLQMLREYYEIVNINQGYSKCNMAILNENSIITEDWGIYEKAKTIGFDVLKLEPGHVKLNGYKYGFIGGAGGLISYNKYFFNGDIDLHPQGYIIRNFFDKHNIQIIGIKNKQLEDFGSIIQFIEEV
ncbi:MAG TPA: hypothetical protein GXZ23_02800 [Clostridiales bacterium]|nr:hypothetical protein [Clostridiales bacterium]